MEVRGFREIISLRGVIKNFDCRIKYKVEKKAAWSRGRKKKYREPGWMFARGRVSDGIAVIERVTTEAARECWKLPELRLWLVLFTCIYSKLVHWSQNAHRYLNGFQIKTSSHSAEYRFKSKSICLNIWIHPSKFAIFLDFHSTRLYRINAFSFLFISFFLWGEGGEVFKEKYRFKGSNLNFFNSFFTSAITFVHVCGSLESLRVIKSNDNWHVEPKNWKINYVT